MIVPRLRGLTRNSVRYPAVTNVQVEMIVPRLRGLTHWIYNPLLQDLLLRRNDSFSTKGIDTLDCHET